MSGFKADTTFYNNAWAQNSMPTYTPTFAANSWGNFTPNVYGWGTTASGASSSSDSYESFEDFQKKEAKKNKEKLTRSNDEKNVEEIKKTGLDVTKKQLDDIEQVAIKSEKDKHRTMTIGEEVGCYTTMGAIGALGLNPIANSKTYLFGEHNKLFSKATDIYGIKTEANLFEESITTESYNKVYRKNAKIMSDAKQAMKKAERLTNKASWQNKLDKDLYDNMSKEMKNVLKELAKDPKSETARTQLKNLTEAINKTTSQRVGWVKGSWRKIKNNTIRRWGNKTPLKIEQPNVEAFKTNLNTITARAQQTGQASGALSKGAKLLKGTGRLLKKTPWLVGVFEAFMDKDKISAAYKKDSTTGNKQLGKTLLKAGGAMAGMALGTKLGLAIGSVVPGLGNIVGGIIGAVAGFAIGGACSWLGREAGKIAGDYLIDKKDIGSIAIGEDIKKVGTEEQLNKAIETVTWANENKDKLTKAELDSIKILEAKLDAKLVRSGYLQNVSA